MYGTVVRAAFALAVGALLTVVLRFTLGIMDPILQDGAENAPEASNADMVVGYFTSVGEWFALVVLLSIGGFVLYRAVLENRVGRGGF